ncbi:hypothetical protein ANAPC5_01402 [Anaplasma phagocytophilum]|nr:hypothetical protein ANAPC5_01402 [Anaplasma phagocytophilum]
MDSRDDDATISTPKSDRRVPRPYGSNFVFDESMDQGPANGDHRLVIPSSTRLLSTDVTLSLAVER